MIGNNGKRIYLKSGVRFQANNRPVNKMLHNDCSGKRRKKPILGLDKAMLWRFNMKHLRQDVHKGTSHF